MSNKTDIPYADCTWSPVIGCTPVNSGCVHCWSERLHTQRYEARLNGKKMSKQYQWPFDVVDCIDERLEQPLHWRKPRTIFVNSQSDTFHRDVPFEFIDKIFNIMINTPRHTYLIFTKRYERAYEYFELSFPIPNIYWFFSASTQKEVDKAVPILLQIPAAVRGLSLEPLLTAVNLHHIKTTPRFYFDALSKKGGIAYHSGVGLDSIIVGCESGPNRRPCKIEWVKRIVEQCREAQVCCYVKRLEIDGKVVTDVNKFAKDLQVRQWPKGE